MAMINKAEVGSLQKAQWMVDFMIFTPPMIIGGTLLIKKKALGIVSGISLLLAVSLLFIGLVPIMIYLGVSGSDPIDWIGILTVLVCGLISFVPLAKFIRGASRYES